MNLKELENQISNLVAKVQNLVASDDLEGATKAKAELEAAQKKYDLVKDIEKDTPAAEELQVVEQVEKTATQKFAAAARAGFPKNSMSEGTSADGGYTVPVEIETKIEKYRDTKASLRNLVTVRTVTTLSGQRTFKKKSQQTGFTSVAEGGKIGAKNTPQFERKSWAVSKYAGYFVVTNELLDDSDANIEATLVEWIGDESRVTDNNLILSAINTKEKTALADLDAIKKAINVTLGQAFKNTSRIITNDDGLNYLDTLKDGDGNYILRNNPADPMMMHICAGALTIPVTVLPNNELPSDTTTSTGKTIIPMIIGDLKEYVELVERKGLTVMNSNTAAIGTVNAFEEDLTIWRAIKRQGTMIKDDAAIVNGIITVTA